MIFENMVFLGIKFPYLANQLNYAIRLLPWQCLICTSRNTKSCSELIILLH